MEQGAVFPDGVGEAVGVVDTSVEAEVVGAVVEVRVVH